MEEEQPDWLPVTGMRFQNGEPINGVPLFPSAAVNSLFIGTPRAIRREKREKRPGWWIKQDPPYGQSGKEDLFTASGYFVILLSVQVTDYVLLLLLLTDS